MVMITTIHALFYRWSFEFSNGKIKGEKLKF